jgi:hypothetical protein
MVIERRNDMRTVHWLFVVSVALFLGGIGFISAAARTARDAPAVDEVAVTVPIATVKQIMNGIVAPAATVVFESVSTTVTAAGIDDKFPRSDAEWEAVGNSAVALAEAGNLLMMEGRAIDKTEWVKMSQAMIDAATVTLKAAQAKSADGILDSGDAVNQSCDNCHMRYQR